MTSKGALVPPSAEHRTIVEFNLLRQQVDFHGMVWLHGTQVCMLVAGALCALLAASQQAAAQPGEDVEMWNQRTFPGDGKRPVSSSTQFFSEACKRYLVSKGPALQLFREDSEQYPLSPCPSPSGPALQMFSLRIPSNT